MTSTNLNIEFVQDTELTISVLQEVGKWVQKNSTDNFGWWNPDILNLEYLTKYAKPEEFYCAIVNGIPAACAILTTSEEGQSWKIVDGNNPKKALYRHWLGVKSEYRGTGLPKIFTDFAIEKARERELDFLRVDVDGSKDLLAVYKKLGFELVAMPLEDGMPKAYFQIKI